MQGWAFIYGWHIVLNASTIMSSRVFSISTLIIEWVIIKSCVRSAIQVIVKAGQVSVVLGNREYKRCYDEGNCLPCLSMSLPLTRVIATKPNMPITFLNGFARGCKLIKISREFLHSKISFFATTTEWDMKHFRSGSPGKRRSFRRHVYSYWRSSGRAVLSVVSQTRTS